MKRTAIVRRSALRAKTAMKRSAMRRHRAALSAAHRRAYHEATERARTDDGFLICEGCGRSLREGEGQRHHVAHRSQGGATTPENLMHLCLTCHMQAHGQRVMQ